MRKRTKKKKRSCALCKPHKTCGSCRWSGHDLARLKEWEIERKVLLGLHPCVILMFETALAGGFTGLPQLMIKYYQA